MKRIQKVLIQKKTIIAIISLFCLILGSCSSKIDKKNNVAYVDGQAISKNLYEKELSYYQKFYLKKYGNDYLDKKTKNGLTNYERLESELLDSLIQDQIMINDLRKNKVK
ncbi:SurA N-terminal domain-containing protein, partial [Anaerococcus hydrogenalis]|uniref:SurA N-terminal domain-containing protein n=1 Tax=Anaerococcus hydrogenalis TaxID=33029 RepID=UPI0023F48CBB